MRDEYRSNYRPTPIQLQGLEIWVYYAMWCEKGVPVSYA